MDNQHNTKITFLEFAEGVLQTTPPKSVTAYALGSLVSAMRREGVATPDADTLKLWVAEMSVGGRKASTCRAYFGKARSAYETWRSGDEANAFSEAAPSLAELRDSASEEASANLGLVKRLLAKDERSADWQASRIFLYLLFNPGASLEDVAQLTFSGAPRFCPQVDGIISSFGPTHGRKYVFRLGQGKSRPREISRRLARELGAVAASAGMRFSGGFARSSITAIWVAAVLKAGIGLRDVRACIGAVPPEWSALSLVGGSDVDEAAKNAVLRTVADAIDGHNPRWFAMRLRPGVSVGDVRRAVGTDLPGSTSPVELFCPMRPEVRKEKGRLVTEDVPCLPGVVFFRMRAGGVRRLFASIGDLAWCYRQTASSDSEYASIPGSQMEAFQRCVGSFTADIRIGLVASAQPLERGRKVKIVGGVMAGYEGEILDVDGEPGSRMLFLTITDSLRASWTAHVEDAFIQPLP